MFYPLSKKQRYEPANPNRLKVGYNYALAKIVLAVVDLDF